MPHALIVDDDPQTREALGALTAAEGFSVAAAADLREARIQMTRQQPDVLLLDVALPDGSGLDLIPEVERRSGTEIVLITGNASVETAVEALRVGAADYLTKPVNVARLRSAFNFPGRRSDQIDWVKRKSRMRETVLTAGIKVARCLLIVVMMPRISPARSICETTIMRIAPFVRDTR